MWICLPQRSTLQENSGICVRELFIHSDKDMSDSASSFSNSGDEYIPRAINTLCILCAWLGTSGRQLARGRIPSLLQEDSFCLWSSQMQNGIQPWPYWYLAQLPWRLFQASMPQAYGVKWRQREAGKTIQTSGKTADLVKWNMVLEKMEIWGKKE